MRKCYFTNSCLADCDPKHFLTYERRYEDAIYGVMINCADHPNQPLEELEVFIGFIMNKRGAQTHRQRDRSIKLKDEFERIGARLRRRQ